MQMIRWQHLSTDLWGISLRCNLFRKRIGHQVPIVATPNLNVRLMVCKIFFFAPNCPIFRPSAAEEEQRDWQLQSGMLFKQTQKSPLC